MCVCVCRNNIYLKRDRLLTNNGGLRIRPQKSMFDNESFFLIIH
jgi:hypothetical protein